MAILKTSGGGVRLCDWVGGKLTERVELRSKRLPKRTSTHELLRMRDADRKKSGETPGAETAWFSPSGKTLFVQEEDYILRAWDLSGKAPVEKAVFDDSQLGRNKLFLSDDLVATTTGPARFGSQLELWDMKGETPRLLAKADGAISPMALSPDRKTLATAFYRPRSIQLWDISEKEPKALRNLLGFQDTVMTLTFSPDGKLVASTHYDNHLCLWPLDNTARKRLGLGQQETHRRIALPARPGRPLFYPDGKTLALALSGGRVFLLDTDQWRERFPPSGHTAPVVSVTFSPDGKTLASGSVDGASRLWDLTGTKPKEIAVVRGCKDAVSRLVFAPFGSYLGGLQHDVRIWELSRRTLKSISVPKNGIDVGIDVDFSPSGEWLAIMGADDSRLGRFREPLTVPAVHLWQFVRGEVRGETIVRPHVTPEEVKRGVDQVEDGRFSPDGKLLAFILGHCYERVVIWEMNPLRDKEHASIRREGWRFYWLAFSPDSKTLAIGGTERVEDKGELPRVWLFNIRAPKPQLRSTLKDVTRPMFSPDGKTLICLSENKRLILYDTTTGRKIQHLQLPLSVREIAYAPDSRHLALGTSHGTVYVLRLLSASEIRSDLKQGEKK